MSDSMNPTGEGPQRDQVYNSCEFVESVAAELALGSLSGRERAAALSHLQDCGRCRDLVDDLSSSADALLLAVPETDPPPGFEARLLERRASILGGRRRRPMRTALRPLMLAAAAAILAAAGVLGGLSLDRSHQGAHDHLVDVRTAFLHQPGISESYESPVRGEAVLARGRPAWVLMTVHDKKWSGWLHCYVSVEGHYVLVGAFQVRDGYGSWASPLKADGYSVHSVRLVRPGGSVLASASFSS
jgi:hypothetical protein